MVEEQRIFIPPMSWNVIDDKSVDIVAGFREVTRAANEATEKIAELGRKISADPQLHTEQLLLDALDEVEEEEEEEEEEYEEVAFERKVQLFRMNAKTAFPYAACPELCWVLEAVGVKATHVTAIRYRGPYEQYEVTLLVTSGEMLDYEERLIIDEPYLITEIMVTALTYVTFCASGDLEAALNEFSPYFVKARSSNGSWSYEA